MYFNKDTFKKEFKGKVELLHAKTFEQATDRELFNSLASLVRDYISSNWIKTNEEQITTDSKQVYYLCIEFLLGRLLNNYLVNLGIRDVCEEGLKELGIDLNVLEDKEEDAGIGNGGLGRLAACYLDSMASLGLPGHGCGIRYRYGLFEQKIVDGYQVEFPDNWLKGGKYIWEYRRPEEAVEVRFGGNVKLVTNGKMNFIHENYESVLAVPYDVPVVGYKNKKVNTLRLWSAEAPVDSFSCSLFNRHDCGKLIQYRHSVETITDVLYPDDSHEEGKILRLKQQYFLVSAAIQTIMHNYRAANDSLKYFSDKIAIHINDTHPALAIPELMRLLMDEAGMGWDEAWAITTKTMSYTNHTILPEALETWPVDMVKTLLPRIYMIIHEINERFCKDLWQKYTNDLNKISAMAVISHGRIHMANLAIVGSHSVNGVAKIHTKILKTQVMSNFYNFYPNRFNNKTNGVTHRRWMLAANPLLAELISNTIGTKWIEYPCELIHLLKYTDDISFQQEVSRIKTYNKIELAKYIKEKHNINIDVNSIFDVHIKRIHAYKRQSLNALHIMDLYNRLRENPNLDIVPRTFIFGGKAAQGYYKAKKTIKLINTLAQVINNDRSIKDKIKVVFLENYNVSFAELIIPATDVSEQIPTASREACGTGNMKFMMNGAVTIGTLDGANIEIKNAVGDDNIVVFGLTANEVLDFYRHGGYNPWDIYHNDARVKKVMEQLINGFLPVGREEFRTHYDAFLHQNDYYFVLKDFASYVDAQNMIEAKYSDNNLWMKMSINNIAQSGKFSSDRTFSEYSMDIWKLNKKSVRCYCEANEAFALSLKGCEKNTSSAILM